MPAFVRRVALPAVVATAILGLSACSESTEEKEAAACDAYANFQEAVAGLDTLTPESTVDEISSAREDAATAYEDLENAADEVAESRSGELEDAIEALEDAIKDIDGDATVPEAAASLREEVDAVRTARDDLAAELSC